MIVIYADDNRINDNAHFSCPDDTFFGSHCAVDFGAYATTNIIAHYYVHLAPFCTIIGGSARTVEFMEFCWTAAGSRLVAATDMPPGLIGPAIPMEYRDNLAGDIKLERHAGIYSNGVVGPGVTMREGSLLAANSFLNHDAEPWTVYGGNPAKPISDRSPHKNKIIDDGMKLLEHYELKSFTDMLQERWGGNTNKELES